VFEGDLPNVVPVVGNGQMLLELVEAHFGGLTPIAEEPFGDVPATGPRHAFLWLCERKCFLVTNSSPQARIVVVATGFVGLIRPHLGLAKVLRMD